MSYRDRYTPSAGSSRGYDHNSYDRRDRDYGRRQNRYPATGGNYNQSRYPDTNPSAGSSYNQSRYPSDPPSSRDNYNQSRYQSGPPSSRDNYNQSRYQSGPSSSRDNYNQSRYQSGPPSSSGNYTQSRYQTGPPSSRDNHSYSRYPSGGSASSTSHNGYGRTHTHSSSSASGQPRGGSFSSGYESGYASPGYVSPVPQSPTITCPGPQAVKLFDVNNAAAASDAAAPAPAPVVPEPTAELERSVEYHQAPDTFPCGHVLCHQCLRKFMKSLGGPGKARCPVCGMEVSGEDVSLASMGLPNEPHGDGHDHPHDHDHDHQHQQQPQQEAPISLLSNYDEIVKKFNGLQQGLRRLKDESVQARSMGMTYTNTVCHLCRQAHPTLRVIQEQNQLEVRHERPQAWRSPHYFYRLQHGKVVTTFHSKVNAATICVPCTYRELRECKAILPPEVHQALPDLDPGHNQQLALAEVGKLMAKNTAPLMALKGKNVIEVDHKVRVRERADNFQFAETAEQIERMVRQQEDTLLRHATKQIRDTGQLYHVQESNEIEVDNDETLV